MTSQGNSSILRDLGATARHIAVELRCLEIDQRTGWQRSNTLRHACRQPGSISRVAKARNSNTSKLPVMLTKHTSDLFPAMSLQEASDARKARLIALRNRKEGLSTASNGYVIIRPWYCIISTSHRDSVLLSRNYDPETRTLKKHSKNDVLTTDTVEKTIEGVAEMIIAEDERQRAQELVCRLIL